MLLNIVTALELQEIVVSVVLNTMQQIQAHLLAHQYEGLLKKSRLKGRK